MAEPTRDFAAELAESESAKGPLLGYQGQEGASDLESGKDDLKGDLAAGALGDPYVLILFIMGSSFMLLTQAAIIYRGNQPGSYLYALIVGGGSFGLTVFYLILDKCGWMNSLRFDKLLFFLSVLLFLWWGFGVFVLTSEGGPFTNTGNGYFACWVGFASSAFLAHTQLNQLRSAVARFRNSGSDANLALGVCSAIVIWQASTLCFQKSNCTGYTIWAMTCGIVSLLLNVVFVLCPLKAGKPSMFFSIFFALWWVAGAGVMTFEGPFNSTGNGYFGAWGACLASLVLAKAYWTLKE